MKVQIRDGFVCVVENVVEETDLVSGRIVKRTQRTTLWPGKVHDLDEGTVAAHAHKLEPRDREAADFLAATHVRFADQTSDVAA